MSVVECENHIQVMGGRKFTYSCCHPEEVDINDIALSLSRMPRFAGFTREFYSVAQHSVLVSRQVEQVGGNQRRQLVGLLHDATEAYMCDIPKPLKDLMPDYVELERQVWAKICCRYLNGDVEIPKTVKDCDISIYHAEVRDLRDVACGPQIYLRAIYQKTVVPWPMEMAQKLFIDRYRELTEYAA